MRFSPNQAFVVEPCDLIATLRSGSPTALRIGFTSLVEKRTLELIIDLARSVYQSCDIISDGYAVERLESKVREGELHAALVTLPLVDSEGLTTHVIERERLVVCMRNDEPLSLRRYVPRVVECRPRAAFIFLPL